MKAFLLECSAPFWIEVVKELQSDIKLQPVYWTAWHLSANGIKSQFENCYFHDTADAKKNIPLLEFKNSSSAPFDGCCESVWIEEAQIVYDMMNRFDHSRDWQFIERQKYFYEALIYWNSILNTLQPEVVIFPCPPHVVYDYIVLSLCRRKKIKMIMFDEAASFPPYCLVMEDFSEGDINLIRGYKKMLEDASDKSIALKSKTKDVVERIRSIYSDAKPIREVEAHKSLRKRSLAEKKQELLKILKSACEGIKHIYFGRKLNESLINNASVIKEKRHNLKDSFIGPFQVYRYMWQSFFEKNLSEKRFDFYHNLTSNVDLEKKYIYISLAGQPERTSNPQGGIFTYQLLIINILANSVPEGWMVYVKEHPNQFHPNMYVNMYRNEEFYLSISNFKNVKLIPTGFDPFRLIDNSQAVVTICGTTGIEAILRGKPAILFGKAWYKNCHGAFPASSYEELKKIIQVIEKGFDIDNNKVMKFLKAVENYTFEGLADPLPEWYGVSNEENIKALVTKIKELIIKPNSMEDMGQ